MSDGTRWSRLGVVWEGQSNGTEPLSGPSTPHWRRRFECFGIVRWHEGFTALSTATRKATVSRERLGSKLAQYPGLAVPQVRPLPRSPAIAAPRTERMAVSGTRLIVPGE